MEQWMVSKYWPSVVLLVIGALIFFAGYWLVSKNKVEVEIYEAIDQKNIIIDIGGGVLRAGVYELRVGSRLKDALVMAGGLSEDADRAVFEQSFNMAQILKDGEKIYVPTKLSVASHTDNDSASSVGDKISINRASKDSLMTLSGIGESRAIKIVEGRPYKSLEELVSRKIISASIFSDIKNQLVLW
jgi:competence protein ComEA